MPRIARLVIPDCPHHVIQRGNRRLRAFFADEDKRLYCRLLSQEALKHGVIFWAYCLMDNHVHLVAVPKTMESLAKAIGEAHRKYTNAINIRENWRGYLWQGRFLSYPLDEAHLYSVVRYIENNPVRSKIIQRAEDYPWSSAKSHALGTQDLLLSKVGFPLHIADWASYLRQTADDSEIRCMKQHERTGRPLGDVDFIRRLEKLTGRVLAPKKRGRKKR